VVTFFLLTIFFLPDMFFLSHRHRARPYHDMKHTLKEKGYVSWR
jgi:hypothetical protein